MLTSVRVIGGAVGRACATSYRDALDDIERYGFPAVIRFCVYTLSIVFDLLLIPILILFRDAVVIVLIANTYLNAMSSALGKINLRQQIHEHEKTRAIAQAAHDHAEETHRLTREIHRRVTAAPPPPAASKAPPKTLPKAPSKSSQRSRTK